jgi:DNA-binding NarL/FixJ family response regulator
MATTVLIVDDHPSFRATARAVLEAEGYEVVGEAQSGVEGLRLARELHPDIVLLDVQLPDFDGFEVASRLLKDDLGVRIVITSSRDATDFGRLIQQSGVCGFVPKAELSGSAIASLVR